MDEVKDEFEIKDYAGVSVITLAPAILKLLGAKKGDTLVVTLRKK